MALCDYRQHDDGIVCRHCGHRRTWSRIDSLPKRQCNHIPKPVELTATGKLLASMKPGDGVKWLADHTGLSWFVDPAKCGCKNRQAWLNSQWQRFVASHFAERGKNVSPFARSGTQGGTVDMGVAER